MGHGHGSGLITVLVDAERSSRPSVIHPSNSSQRNPGHDLLRLPRLLSLASSFPRWCRSIPWVYKRWRRGKTMPLMMSTASTRSIEAVTKANGNGAQMVPAILATQKRRDALDPGPRKGSRLHRVRHHLRHLLASRRRKNSIPPFHSWHRRASRHVGPSIHATDGHWMRARMRVPRCRTGGPPSRSTLDAFRKRLTAGKARRRAAGDGLGTVPDVGGPSVLARELGLADSFEGHTDG